MPFYTFQGLSHFLNIVKGGSNTTSENFDFLLFKHSYCLFDIPEINTEDNRIIKCTCQR